MTTPRQKASVTYFSAPRQCGSHNLSDPDGRTYRDLNKALEMDFWLLGRWHAKHAPKLQVIVTPT